MSIEDNIIKPKGIMIIRENLMPTVEIFNVLADVSHRTWMRQRSKYKGIPIEQIPKEISEEDFTRAKAAWMAIKERKPKNRGEAVALVAESSHQIWLEGQKAAGKDEKELDSNPNDHDKERALDLVVALEDIGVIRFV